MKFMNKVMEAAKGKKVKALEEQQKSIFDEMMTVQDGMVEMTKEQQETFEKLKADWLELEIQKSKILGIRGAIGVGVVAVGTLGIVYGLSALAEKIDEGNSEEWDNYTYDPTVDFLTGSESENNTVM